VILKDDSCSLILFGIEPVRLLLLSGGAVFEIPRTRRRRLTSNVSFKKNTWQRIEMRLVNIHRKQRQLYTIIISTADLPRKRLVRDVNCPISLGMEPVRLLLSEVQFYCRRRCRCWQLIIIKIIQNENKIRK